MPFGSMHLASLAYLGPGSTDWGMVFWILVIPALVLGIVWLVQIIKLASLGEEYFESGWERLGWVALFVLFPVIVPIVFMIWRRAKERRLAGAPTD